MASAQPADYSQAYDFLYRIERRIGLLERDASFIEKQIVFLDNKKDKTFDLLKIEMKELRSGLAELKNHLSKCSHSMASLGKDMREAVKKDDIQSLNLSLDEIQFEEYITRKDLQRGV